MTISQLLPYQPAGRTGNALPVRPIGLADEHGQLLRQVAARAEAVLAEAAADHWPAAELKALLGYLREEILRQVGDEELLLFPAYGAHHARLDRLAHDHARLRASVEALEHAGGDGARSPEMLVTAVRDFLRQLELHMVAEEDILTVSGRPGGALATTALGAHSHDWYPLTEGPVIDLDALPAEQAVAAAVERLRQLRPGECVELRSGSDPCPGWERMDELAPRRYGFVYLENGPDHWRVRVTHRERE
ncbi:MAG: hemerythrin domain-containing protein [Kitasatospora sp.]|jgi:uncharacterized protein (DUF2249 family)|nr:hemerythrin domain-containing protein [Kitasatospora sp.]